MGKFMPRLIKLHRSKNHRMIAGVMGGIAEYLGWSPNMVRIAFVIISSLSAAVPGILIYLVLWLIMPNATPNSYATNLVQYDRSKPL
ncbi:putative stress-responsive transcriptional regulator [Moraxella catarrhalis]|uniref:Stress-responsive transcriptional regulator n=3 Tax=Moraxella catarrhalis TaxID=480 RepID=A0AB36DPA8_MORCA|nr:putative stress-responsive transcriptional regulator [Moraxella catarrhalis]